MRDKVAKRLGMEVTAKHRVTIEITMSEDWAECVAAQGEALLESVQDPKEKQELRDVVSAIFEVLG